MRNTLFFFIAFTVTAINGAQASVKLDANYSCTVSESNDKNVPVGSPTKGGITLRSLAATGAMLVKTPNDTGLIDFYGPLTIYDALAPQSGFLVLATKFADQREVQGSIFVSELSERKIGLDIKIFQMTRVFENPGGSQAFAIRDWPGAYKLTCEEI